MTTTIKGKLEDQLDDRMITSHPNTTNMQTRDIIERTADMAASVGNPVDEKIFKAYRHYHDSLISEGVVISYAQDIAAFVSRKGSLPVSARRAFKRVLSGIKTITLLYQKQRRRDEQGRFIADYSDYAIVYQLLEESFAESLGCVKRYTDDRIQFIEKAGMMTPRDLAERTGVTTAAISQWSKQLIEKGALGWFDETGAEFDGDLALEKAKRSGKAYLFVSGGKSLPSPFQLTGDQRWDKGGDFYEAYDLKLDHGDAGQAGNSDESVNVVEDSVLDDGDAPGKRTTAVNVLSEKTNDDIKKMMKTFREKQTVRDVDDFIGDQLSHEFSEILSNEGIGAVN